MDTALGLLGQCRARDDAAAARMALLGHAARRYHYIADRELSLAKIASTLAASRMDSAAWGETRTSLARLESELREISAEYRSLWLRWNNPRGLEPNLQRLDRQLAEIHALQSAAGQQELRVWTSTAAERIDALPAAH
jgi:hypothetical protein